MNFNPRTPCGVRHDRFLAFDRRRARFQSTHPVRGATLVFRCSASRRGISIHAPRAGCDYDVLRGHSRAGCISIHAPRAGCDIEPNFFSFIPLNFNPRTPCGVRHGINALMQVTELISIHAPRAGCDSAEQKWTEETNHISIHAPRAGCDGTATQSARSYQEQFQSTHPVRGATRRPSKRHLNMP